MNNITIKQQRVNPWLGVLIVLALAVVVNVVVQSMRVKVDVTEEKVFTLSPGTVSFIQDIEAPVTLKYYYSRGNQVPSFLKQYIQRTSDLLREVERAGGGKIALEIYDPKPDSDEEEWAQRYGLVGQPVNPVADDGMLYIGLVAVSGQREAALPFMAPNAEAQLEYNIARLLHEVTRVSKPKLGILSTLPVMGRPSSPMMRARPPDTSWVMVQELRRHYDVTSLRPDADSIPDDVTTLLVIHPKQLPETTVYAIDQFVMRGGRLIVMQDPLSLAERESNPEMASMGVMMGLGSDLNQLTKAWGVEMNRDEVIADPGMASPITFGNGMSERMAAWLSVRPEHVSRDDVLTAQVKSLMMPFAGGLEITTVEGITVTPLVFTTTNAVMINSMMATMPGPEKMRDAQPVGQRPLVVRLVGTFTSAFTNGPPTASEGAPVPDVSRHVARAEKDGLVVIISDVDFATDQHAFRIMNLLGQTMAEMANDNFNFVLGIIEQGTGSEALIGLRSRGVQDRAFTRVLALEQAAQQRWQKQELVLMEKLQETQRKLSEIQMTRDDKQQLVITPEQKAEIEEFRKIRFDTQRELKTVRRNLRQEIETLGVRVKAVNIAAVPLVVAVYGIIRGWRRRR